MHIIIKYFYGLHGVSGCVKMLWKCKKFTEIRHMKKLSVIIPVYNVEKYIAKCLDSVIYPELSGYYEIIIVNDGSTDSSPEICRDYSARFPDLIRVITTENGGLGAARDVGIDAASGERLLFLDSDDYLSANALPEMFEYLDKDFDILFFDIRSVNEDGRLLKYINGCKIEGEFTLESFPELLFEMPSAWNKIYRRTLFTEHGIYYPGRVWYEDMYVTPRLYTIAGKMLSVHKPWHNYLQRAGSITNNANTARNLEIIPAVNSMLDAFRAAGLYDKYFEQLEFSAFHHEVITSIARVNLADRKSGVQDKLFDDYREKFPNYLNNRYVRSMGAKYRIIHFCIRTKNYLLLNLIMKTNNKIRGK